MTVQQQNTTEADREKLDAIRNRYTAEANKRFRPEGIAQFVPLIGADEGRLRALAEDPWVDHEALNSKDSPIKDKAVCRIFVLGAGFGGLQFAVRLIEEGVATADDIRIADAAGGFGGTWYWNRYPGLHCDLESYIYIPLLEETGYIPEHKYSRGEEIRLHAERIADQWKLADKALFRSEVKRAQWDDDTQLWTIRLTQQRGPAETQIDIEFQAQYVYLAAGVLTRPHIPRIPGLPSFSGAIFHTARWNYNVSGGSPTDQKLTGLRGKKVAVIGTAATAVGVIPEVAKFAEELYVIQRTPAYVKERNQTPTSQEDFRTKISAKKGWQFERQCNFNRFLTNSAQPGLENLVGDGWTDMPSYSALLGSPSHRVIDPDPENLAEHATRFHALDLPHMEAVRSRVDKLVKDPETAAQLKPWYPTFCKRPAFSDMYLQVFNQPNVHLVDTDGKGPSRATEKGLLVGDKEYPLDVVIFSTGYQTAINPLESPASRTGVEVIGRGGQSMDTKWKTNGPATLHGYATAGFPNLFFSGASQATVTGNNVMMLGIIAEHITYMIGQAERRVGTHQRAIIEVSPEAEEAHTAEILKRAPFFSALQGCTPGYFNGYGGGASNTDPEQKKKRARGSTWSEGTLSFLDYIKKWRDEGSLEGLIVVPASS
ncbi:hypothetical protein ACJ41O_015256 [Fusarium nematophilum]